ncbi:MAG: hypothetical protein ABFS56_25460 [Pseudomonadota bacterium]
MEKPALLLAEMGEDSSQLDDWDYTPIWALFTPLKKSIMFRRFKRNLAELTYPQHILASKALCMNSILHGKTVPNDVKSCQRHRSRAKNWDYTPVGSTDHYIYLPRHLVP